MGKANNNEYSVLEYLEECVPPNIFFKAFGGNISNVPDLLATDINDPFQQDRESVIKAHYVILGHKLYLHTPGLDPWNIEGVYRDLNLDFGVLKDSLVQITKRPAGATRKSGSSGGPLEPGDSRYVSFALRFWVETPEHGIDLSNTEHQEALKKSIDRITNYQYLPYATFDAKMASNTQFVGPSITVNRDEDRSLRLSVADCGPFQGSIEAELGKAIFTDNMALKINDYFDTLGIECSSFKVVSDNSDEPGVPESKYKSVCFNETIPLDTGLVSTTLRKEVKNGIPPKPPRKRKGKK